MPRALATTGASNGPAYSEPTLLQLGVFALSLCACLAAYLARFDAFQVGIYTDDASYAVLARSLAKASRYGLMNVPGVPLPTRYPFGFPLLLSLVVIPFPESLDAMKLVSLITTLANGVLIFVFWRRLCPSRSHWLGLATAALYLSAPLTIGHSAMIMAEPTFMLGVLISLLLAERCVRCEHLRGLHAILLGIMAGYVVFIRTPGVIVWIALTALLYHKLPQKIARHVLALAALGAGMTVLLVVLLTPVSMADLVPAEYVDQLRRPDAWGQAHVSVSLIPRFFGGLRDYVTIHVKDALLPVGGGTREIEFGRHLGIGDLGAVTSAIVSGITALGFVSSLSRNRCSLFIIVFEVMYLFVIFIWPWKGSRFLYPVLPFMYLHFLDGIALLFILVRKIITTKHGLRIGAVAATTVAMLLSGGSLVRAYVDRGTSMDHTRDLTVGATWLRANSSPESIVMTQQPQSIYLYSGRKTIDYSGATSIEELSLYLAQNRVAYVLVAPQLRWDHEVMLSYDDYTRNILRPMLLDFVDKNTMELVYASAKDFVEVYATKAK